jgi:DNA polymerase-3 subunit alpha
MWEKLANNEILSVFQFDTPQGIQGISLAKPTSVEEMAALNSIMRLMASEKGAEQPLEKYARFKRNPQLWDQEMNKYHLSGEQKLLLHKYLDYEYGICASQEDIMSMIQNPELGGWSLKDSDMLRKSIAKKDPKLYEELSEKYYNTVKEKNLDINLCNYFWKVLVNTQRGYSFNLSHTLAYSLVGLQNMNLACNYPSIFWNTANLIVDSAGVDEGEDAADIDQDEIIENIEEAENEEDDDEDEEEEVKAKEKVKRAKKTVDYGKIARAIGRFRSYGINILPPNVNTSSFTFTPNVEQNSITYGLRGITRISNDIIKMIMQNRPYTSFNDFMNKNHTTKLPTINLIKSGAFDDVEGIPREEIMENYLNSIADKKQINITNMQWY